MKSKSKCKAKNYNYTWDNTLPKGKELPLLVHWPWAICNLFPLPPSLPPSSRRSHTEVVGSPYWMAPECLNGKEYCEQADVFSYGIVLAETATRLPADPDFMPRTRVSCSSPCMQTLPIRRNYYPSPSFWFLDKFEAAFHEMLWTRVHSMKSCGQESVFTVG